MLTRDTTQGTTLEILAPYLPYGIEVEVKDVRREGHLVLGTELVRGVLIGITNDPLEREGRQKQEVAYSPYEKRWLWRWAYPEMITPVLRPFSALVTPLEDGTIPALIVAALAMPEVTCVKAVIINKGFGQYHCVCLGEQGQHYYAIHRNNFESVRGSQVKNRLDGHLTDKLRQMHFALPVNGRPLIEGVDYIAKSPAPTTATIEKGTAG